MKIFKFAERTEALQEFETGVGPHEQPLGRVKKATITTFVQDHQRKGDFHIKVCLAVYGGVWRWMHGMRSKAT